jgi:hypothetical protein
MSLDHLSRVARYFPHMTEHIGANFPYGDEYPVKESPQEFIARTLHRMQASGEISGLSIMNGIPVVNNILEIRVGREYRDLNSNEVGNYKGTLRNFVRDYLEKQYLGDCQTCIHCNLRWPKDLIITDQKFGQVDPICGTFLRTTEQSIPVEYTLPELRDMRTKAERLWRAKKIEGKYFRVKITRYDGRQYLKPMYRYVRAPHPTMARALVAAHAHDAKWQAVVGDPQEISLEKILKSLDQKPPIDYVP